MCCRGGGEEAGAWQRTQLRLGGVLLVGSWPNPGEARVAAVVTRSVQLANLGVCVARGHPW